MNKLYFTLIFIVVFGCYYSYQRYSPFTNKASANITIYQNDSIIYKLDELPEGKFKLYINSKPKKIKFEYKGSIIELQEINNIHYRIKIDYLDNSKLSDITFM